MPKLRKDDRHFVWYGSTRLPFRMLPGGVLEFVDKNPDSVERRGSRKVKVQIGELIKFAESGEGAD